MRRTQKRSRTFLFTFIVISLLSACKTYYKTSLAGSASSNQTLASLDSLKLQNRFFVLRNGNNAYYMSSLSLSADQKTLQCRLDTLPPNHELYVLKSKNGKGKYKKIPGQMEVLNEVHLYISQDNTAGIGSYTLLLDNVQKIAVLQKDKVRTTRSYIGGAFLITGGALVVAAIIILATKSSCPFVSGYTGEEFTLQGEIYGGAIYPQLARSDYMPLQLKPDNNNRLQIKISNELKERQYTDMADLWVITHKRETKVLADDDGNLYSLSALQQPLGAMLSNGENVTGALLKANDNQVLYFDDTTSAIANNNAIITFRKPTSQQKGKLLLSIKNSYFLDYLYGELAKGFGSYYSTYMKRQKDKPAAELLTWVKEQQIPLEVSVNTAKGWRKIKDITTIGPIANRQVVVPIDLSETNGDIAEIKLSSGFMFWEIDAAAIDYSADQDFFMETLKPLQAVDETGKDILSNLTGEDGVYLEQPQIGNTVTITYQSNAAISPDQARSFILHTKGYYEHIREFEGKPDIKFLKGFTRPNAFPLYGMKQYKKLKRESMAFLK